LYGLEPIAQYVSSVAAEDDEEKQRAAETRMSQLGLVADTLLMVAKGGVGLTSGSAALTADALHSGADMLSSAVVYYCVGQAHEPPDKTYRCALQHSSCVAISLYSVFFCRPPC
jgi:divalent metal cation (Fe/Co/Zn/Cd) transporter